MIYISHNKIEVSGLDQMLHNLGVSKLKLNKDTIRSDIDRLSECRRDSKYRLHIKEIDKTTDYLNRMIAKIDDNDEVEMVWSLSDYSISSYPIRLCSIPELNIDMTDYIALKDDEKLCMIDYRQVLQIIAADMIYRDLGYSTEDMEEKLSDVGITGVYPADRLLQIFGEDDPLALGMIMRIEDTQYKSVNSQHFKSYFNTGDKFDDIKTKYYKDIITPSCKIAMSLLSSSVFNILNSKGIEFKLVSVNNKGIYIIVSDANATKVPKEHAIIRAFGRMFEVTPKLVVF